MRDPRTPAELKAALAGATRVTLAKREELTVRVTYGAAARAADMSLPLREVLDRRLDESARVTARVEGPEVILDVDSTHFLRSGGP